MYVMSYYSKVIVQFCEVLFGCGKERCWFGVVRCGQGIVPFCIGNVEFCCVPVKHCGVG